ncbi:pectinesterase family protein [Paenibacillus sp. P96]|uniref:Pectinesterase family protein n=1 Tax=Paenibacillus zeirhizosphaerae TaxID=2987519 RepID=A0ABT9FSU8_9BACL|nr:pectinesterase family protein [Paenibacillus sp. P96]MDP4097814.1 pectinesterase family protein [Paenibacillus sp. P96]
MKKLLSSLLSVAMLVSLLSGMASADTAVDEAVTNKSLPIEITTEKLSASIPAFPGAEGGGMYTTGGRGGDVYEVTTLADSGPGSLREGVGRSNTTIVFRVGGTIHLESPLKITGTNVTIAGQTAPGEGITVSDYWTSFHADNVIVRYVRFRLGDRYPSEDDAFGGRNYKNIIIDHCSFSWSVDEVLSMYRNENTTVQWSMVSESMLMTTHQKGRHGYGGIWGGNNVTFHHNLIAHNVSRNPRLAGAPDYPFEMFNNIIYNWGFFSAYGGEQGNYNLINNYYKSGPNTYRPMRNSVFHDVAPETRLYIDGNIVEGYPAVTADNWKGVGTVANPASKLEEPVVMPNLSNPEPAETAYHRVLAEAGAVLPKRDAIDARIVHETATGTGRHINSQKEVGGYQEFEQVQSTLADADHDGMPDDWETANGLNPNDTADRNGIHESGYTFLEEYLNGIAGESFANPEVEILTPANNTIAADGETVEITAAASDRDGKIVNVEFYAGDSKLGEDNSTPYSYSWSNVPEGTHFLTVRAVDDSGTSTQSSNVAIHVNREGSIAPWQAADIGTPGIAGHTQLGSSKTDVIVKASGDIADRSDSFHFAYQQLTGNGEIVARIERVTATDDGAEAGVMVRESLNPDSRFVGLFIPYVKGGQKYIGMTRKSDGGKIELKEPETLVSTPYWVKIVRLGDQFTSLTSSDGQNWTVFDSVTMPLSETVYFGLAADASKPDDEVDKYNASTFSNAAATALDADYPTAPSQLTATPGDQSVTLSWSEVEVADTYNVLRSELPGGPYEQIAASVTEASYSDTGLIAGKTYYYIVNAQNAKGISFASAEASAVPEGEPETGSGTIYLVDDEFESEDPDTTPVGYMVTPDPQDDAHKLVVTKVPENMTGNDSAKALMLFDNAAGNSQFVKRFTPQLGTVIIETDVAAPGWPGTSAVLSLQNDSGSRSPLTIEIRKPALPSPEPNYTMTYKLNGADHKLMNPPANNQWYNLKIVAKVATHTADIYVDQVLMADDVPFQADVKQDGITRISAKTPGTGKGTIYYDNIKVYVEPVESPKGLLSVPGNGKVRLEWTAAENAASYNVKRSVTDGGPYETIATDVTDVTYIDETVANGTTYYYVVTAMGTTGESGASNQTSAAPSEESVKPQAPTGVTGNARSSQADLHWESVPYATHYTVKRSDSPEGPFVAVASQISSLTFRDGGLENGATYYYVISATSVAGESEDSVAVSVTPYSHLSTPAFTAKPVPGGAELEWQSVPGAQAYDVKRADHPDGPYTIIAGGVASSVYADSGLINGQPFYYKITAVSDATYSLDSMPIGVRPFQNDGTPAAPAALLAEPGDGSIDLSWEPATGADRYSVRRSTSAAGPFVTVADDLESTQMTDSGLPNGVLYYYVVTASNEAGEGASSVVISEMPAQVLTVAADGSALFKKVQDAIDAVPSGGDLPTIIKIKDGIYREKLDVPSGKSPIRMIGESREGTILVYGDSASTIGPNGTPLGTSGSYSFRVQANDFTAEHLTIQNDAGDDAGQAVALYASADRLTFRDVSLRGWQDTLYAHGGRQYYVDSYIEGDVDFIFGGATAVFENSIIHSLNEGYVTAASTADQSAGYIFLNSRLTSEPGLTGAVSLGRPWRPYSYVMYIHSYMDDHIKPEGWDNWGNPNNETTARYGEFASYGPGAQPQQRLRWTKQLTVAEAAKLTPALLLRGSDGWNPAAITTLADGRNELNSLTVDGEPLAGFDAAKLDYEVKLDQANDLPIVNGVAVSDTSEVTTEQAESVPGTAVIRVTAQDGTVRAYSVHFQEKSE